MKNNVNWEAFVRLDGPHKHMLNKFIHRVEFDLGKLLFNRPPFVVNTDNLKTNKICLKGNNVFLVDLPNPVRILPVKIIFRKQKGLNIEEKKFKINIENAETTSFTIKLKNDDFYNIVQEME